MIGSLQYILAQLGFRAVVLIKCYVRRTNQLLETGMTLGGYLGAGPFPLSALMERSKCK